MIYKSGQLQPRTSDCDHEFLKSQEAETADVVMSAVHVTQRMEELQEQAASFLKVLQESNFQGAPVGASPLTGKVLSSAMMALLQNVMANGGSFDCSENACKQLTNILVQAIEDQLPQQYDEVLRFLHAAGETDNLPVLDKTVFGDLAQFNMGPLFLQKVRIGILTHCLKSLGPQCCNVREGPTITSKPYVPPLVQDFVDKLFAFADLTSQNASKDAGPIEKLDELQQASSLTFMVFWSGVFEKALEAHKFCIEKDGIGFQHNKSKLYEQLMRCPGDKFTEADY